MADLINKITEQLVQGVDESHFLSEIEDAANWIKHEAETVMEAVADAILPPDAASNMPTEPEAAPAPKEDAPVAETATPAQEAQ